MKTSEITHSETLPNNTKATSQNRIAESLAGNSSGKNDKSVKNRNENFAGKNVPKSAKEAEAKNGSAKKGASGSRENSTKNNTKEPLRILMFKFER